MHLVIGGTGPEAEALKSLVKILNINNNVRLLGFVPDNEVASFFASSDIFVLPAIVDNTGDTEGLGMVLLEAMANGVPTIATRVGGITDVVEDGQTGILVEQRNPNQLAEKLALLYHNPTLRASMGLAGRERLRLYFSWTSVVEQTLQVYKSLLPSI